MLAGNLPGEPVGHLYGACASGLRPLDERLHKAAFGARRRDDEAVQLPARLQALFDEAGPFGQEQPRFVARLLPVETPQGLDQRIGSAGYDFERCRHFAAFSTHLPENN